MTSENEKNIYLIGMMGTGKTTIGTKLSEKLGYGFFDTDAVIEAEKNTTIKKIFDDKNKREAYFRELETQVLARLSTNKRCVIATGGGIIKKDKNREYLGHGLTIWLNTDLKILQKRLANDESRPLASELESLLTERRPSYAQADLKIDIKSEKSPDDIVDEIINRIPSVLKSSSSTS